MEDMSVGELSAREMTWHQTLLGNFKSEKMIFVTCLQH